MARRTTRRVSDETRKKMSVAKKGHLNPRWKVKVSATTRHRISEGLKRYWQHLPKV